MTTTNPSLVIMCKRPKLHQGKQRLAQTIGADAAFDIAQLLLACAIEDAQAWSGNVVLAVAHQEDLAWGQALIRQAKEPQAQVIYQGGGNLGQRLNHIDKHLRSQGHQKLVFIGTDAPMLRQAHYVGLADMLAKDDIVLNMAADGGVVIMSNAQPWPDLTNLPWSSSYLGASLAACCHSWGLSVGYHTPGYDIDEKCDLITLYRDLAGEQRPARQKLLQYIATILTLEESDSCTTQ
ncbi:TIGR04282 family arsenosugar biosynthesis glycosyltransferase [Thalassotalea euphylliae]|uniref:DUF2064 domain-containing protein n=1 Tax=Thalassotalea euphylliae TaxID=1655234 RepID=A0A3E0UFV3_9GAMM|nr:DUF2064 domain-containing protein [Thalassotalea euphylliae]REL34642.1 DUF2064 domain-containing protein [Thalassotalea euphylliae]